MAALAVVGILILGFGLWPLVAWLTTPDSSFREWLDDHRR